MAYETIRVSVEDHVQTITLHRPDKLNAFTRQMMDEMIAAFDEADANDDVRVVIVTGEGRAFCAGADLSAGASTFELSARKDRDYIYQSLIDPGAVLAEGFPAEVSPMPPMGVLLKPQELADVMAYLATLK